MASRNSGSLSKTLRNDRSAVVAHTKTELIENSQVKVPKRTSQRYLHRCDHKKRSIRKLGVGQLTG